MDKFDILIWAGAALTMAGLAALVWCILTVTRARKTGMADEELRRKMRGVLAVNMAALAVSALGLMAVVTGILLGR